MADLEIGLIIYAMKSKLLFDVPDYKKIRVIIDTDAACEADDPFAIVQALLSPKAIVRGILAEHFNVPGSVQRSYAEIQTILEAMNADNIQTLMGQEGPLDDDFYRLAEKSPEALQVSPAVDFIIKEASTVPEALEGPQKPLFVLCQGAITNVAAALLKKPEIADRMTIVWIGTHGLKEKAPFREFNAGNDVRAANYVLSHAKNLWLIPSDVYATIRVGLAELQQKVLPCGKIGKHLFEQMIAYNNSEGAGWTKGESWSLGDSPAIAVALNDWAGHYIEHEAPFVEEDTSSSFGHNLPVVRMYTDMDSRYILEDFFAKLQINFGNQPT